MIHSWNITSFLFLTPLSLFVSVFVTTASPLQAGTPKQRVQYNPPQSVGSPRVSNQGATREGECETNTCLIALMPSAKQMSEPLLLTVSERPTFFFNVPKIEGNMYFRLYEQRDNGESETRIHKAIMPIISNSGIIGFRFPSDAPPLAVNKNYRWEFEIGDDITTSKVKGFIRRVNLSTDLSKQLEQAKPLERASIYAKAGIWFETVKTLVDLRCAQPNSSELNTEWADLLKSVKLDLIAEQPIAESCKVTQ